MRTLVSAFHEPGTVAYRWVDGAVWFLIAVSIGLFSIDLFWENHPYSDMLAWVDLVVLILLGIELALRVLTYQPPGIDFYDRSFGQLVWAHVTGRLRFLMRPMNLIDLLTVIAVYPALRGLRALRLFRLARAWRMFKYANPITDVLQAFSANRLLYQAAFTFLGAVTAVGGLSIYLVERNENAQINSVADGMWWAIVTLTTVGFGDISPQTALGRVVGAVLMVAGMFTLALFAGVVGNTLLNAILRIRQEQFRMSNTVGHIVVLGYGDGNARLFGALSDEFERGRAPTIVAMANHPVPTSLPEGVDWVTGDPARESELGKVRLEHAIAVVVVGNRALSPQQADASTLLALFTIRGYISSTSVKRHKPLYIVCEILDGENVEHARTAGADEVIETTRLGYSLIAHAVSSPGTASVMSRVVNAGAHNLYVGRMPADLQAPISFGEAMAHLRRQGDVLLVGVRDPESGKDEINPPDSLVLSGAEDLVYLATRAVLPSK
ncbi:MAG: ion transporter [Myxococcota bacterium]